MLKPECEADLKELNDLLVIYYNKSMKFIEVQHEKATGMYETSYEITLGKRKSDARELQNEVTEIKRNIETTLYNLQKQSKCE